MPSRWDYLASVSCPCGKRRGIEETEHPGGGTSWCCSCCQRSWDPVAVLMTCAASAASDTGAVSGTAAGSGGVRARCGDCMEWDPRPSDDGKRWGACQYDARRGTHILIEDSYPACLGGFAPRSPAVQPEHQPTTATAPADPRQRKADASFGDAAVPSVPVGELEALLDDWEAPACQDDVGPAAAEVLAACAAALRSLIQRGGGK
jgi:hypothetical protein